MMDDLSIRLRRWLVENIPDLEEGNALAVRDAGNALAFNLGTILAGPLTLMGEKEYSTILAGLSEIIDKSAHGISRDILRNKQAKHH